MISDFTHDNIATTLPCSVSLSDFNESDGIHQLINKILHRFIQNLSEFARILKQVPSVLCLYDGSPLTPPPQIPLLGMNLRNPSEGVIFL